MGELNADNITGDATKARFIAAVIDNLLAIFLTLMVVRLIPEQSLAPRAVALVTVYLGYYFVLEALWARTPGKYFQGLVVRKLDGSTGDWKASLIRTVLRVLEVNPVLFGAIPAGLILLSSARKQRLGDVLAGTVVVSDQLSWKADEETKD